MELPLGNDSLKKWNCVLFCFVFPKKKAIKLPVYALHNLIYTLLIFLSTAKFQVISPKAAQCFRHICRLLGVVFHSLWIKTWGHENFSHHPCWKPTCTCHPPDKFSWENPVQLICRGLKVAACFRGFFFVTCVSNCACVQQSPAAPKWFPRRLEQQRASPEVFHYRYL